MAILNNSNAISAGGYSVDNSIRLRSSASGYLSRTPASAGNRKTFTVSFWFKRGTLSVDQKFLSAYSADSDSGNMDFRLTSGNILYWGPWNTGITTTAVFRDPSAWYHIVLAIDTTQATGANRHRVYVNGVEYTFSGTPVTQNTDLAWNNSVAQNIGRNARTSDGYLDGYFADFYNIDGQALTPSSFGETDSTTGVWKPKAYTGTYGTNGFYLKFSDIATTSGSNAGLGKDFSGNTNYWTTNNISVTAGTTYDAMTDVPTNTSATVANYCVLNPLDKASTVTNGNLTSSGGASHLSVRSTIQIPTTGLWYGEAVVTTTTTGSIAAAFGVMLSTASLTASASVATNAWNLYASANKIINNNGSSTTFGTGFTAGDVIQIAVDTNNNRAWFGVNNVWYNNAGGTTGNPSAGTNPTVTSLPTGLFAFVSTYDNTINANFGQRPFVYTPPTGFKALNTFNLPTSTIVKGTTVMDSTLYTGTGATQVVTNSGSMKPDFVWLKSRSNARNHRLMDTVRGINLGLQSDLTNAEYTGTALSSINSNGFTLNTTDNQNVSAEPYIGWQWQAGQGSTSSNTSGSITSTVSVNATAGFSVVTFTAPASTGNFSVGHGLGVSPSMVITKRRDSASQWWVWHISLGNNTTDYLSLNTTNAEAALAGMWGSVGRTSTLLGYSDTSIAVNSTQVAYCWAEIAGFSRFGSYTGNGSTDGPFIYTGFRTRYLLIKCTSTAEQWAIKDTALVPYNTNNTQFFANATDPETTDNTYHMIDFVSNGFKIRGAAQNLVNGNGQNYIYMAFAENPTKYALAR